MHSSQSSFKDRGSVIGEDPYSLLRLKLKSGKMVILVVFGLMSYRRKTSSLAQAVGETLAKLMFVMLAKRHQPLS